MKPVSDRFLTAVRGSHEMRVRVTLVDGFHTGLNPPGERLQVLAGNVQLDAASDVRGTVDVTVLGDWPSRRDGYRIAPYGAEVFVERGVWLGDVAEYAALGYYRVWSVEQDRPDGPLRIEGRDRMSGIVDARLEAPRQFESGTSLAEVFVELVTEVYPTAQIVFDYDADSDTLARSQVAEDDRFAFLRDAAAARGKIMFFDHEGALRVEDPPDPTHPVWDVNYGAGGVLVSMRRRLTRDGVYNAVVAIGEGTDTREPVRAVARDINPRSPTYYYGRFGRVPRFFESSFVTTYAQASRAARSMLAASIGLPYSIDFTAVPCPAVEPYDPIDVKYSDRDHHEVHVIERVTIPLTADEPIAGSTREFGAVTIGVQEG